MALSRRTAVWLTVAMFLLAWNGLTALYANPFTLTQWYDGVQYQLLARNRLAGHEEVGDTAHTVGREGRHPMWRPGLVWIEQALAAGLGSVRWAAAVASALGTTFLELALLRLAWRCFGVGTWLAVLLALVAPSSLGATFLGMAVGQGPEPWAAACIVVGLTGLTEALCRPSRGWAVAAGLAAGMAEMFRTGTLILFIVPCGIYGLAYLSRRDGARVRIAGAALAGLLLMAILAGWAVPSVVDKTVANLGHNLAENEGPFLSEDVPGVGWVNFSMGGYRLVPGTQEVVNDYLVRKAREMSAADYLERHAEVLVPLYLDRLAEVVEGQAGGLRWMVGELVLAFFVLQVVVALTGRDDKALATLALTAAALAYYLGPVVLLRGDQPTHYLLLALPLFVLVAARGAANAALLAGGAWTTLGRCLREPGPLGGDGGKRKWLPALLLAPLVVLCANFYLTVLFTLRDYQEQAGTEQTAVDALPLEGRTVACRNMSWFVDRDVRTILLPYATVAELEGYVQARGIDGILVWEHETQLFFWATPYGSLQAFDQALRQSPVFDSPQVSGGWRWYAVRRAGRFSRR
jgi:hypothetical protein